MSDVRDILELGQPKVQEISKAAILGLNKSQNAQPKKREKEVIKKPEGMARELFALLYSSDGIKELPPLLQTDTMPQQGYKSMKARLGMRRVRPWEWVQFSNPARKDGALFWHWRRVVDQGKEYPFAEFNKHVEILQYSDSEYQSLLVSETWSRQDTDVLWDLCNRFDLRWPVILDRFKIERVSNSSENPAKRTMEDIKERYYQVTNALKKARNSSEKLVHFDADHERRRKNQLCRIWDRTPQQVEEEQNLLSEMRRIEARKKERERKTQDLQKLISGGSDGIPNDPQGGPLRKKGSTNRNKRTQVKADTPTAPTAPGNMSEGIKFLELRGFGTTLRSSTLKLPQQLGQKRTKAIDSLLSELSIEQHPMPIEKIGPNFNSLRSDMDVLYKLRSAMLDFVFELQTEKHACDDVIPGQDINIPSQLQNVEGIVLKSGRSISDVLDKVSAPTTPSRKRKITLEQNNALKRFKNRHPAV